MIDLFQRLAWSEQLHALLPLLSGSERYTGARHEHRQNSHHHHLDLIKQGFPPRNLVNTETVNLLKYLEFKEVLSFFGFKTPDVLSFNWQFLSNANDETQSGYKKEYKSFMKDFN